MMCLDSSITDAFEFCRVEMIKEYTIQSQVEFVKSRCGWILSITMLSKEYRLRLVEIMCKMRLNREVTLQKGSG